MKLKDYQQAIKEVVTPKGHSIFMPSNHSHLNSLCYVDQMKIEKPLADHSEVGRYIDDWTIKFDPRPTPKDSNFPKVVVPTVFPTMTILGYYIPEIMGVVPKGHTTKMLKDWAKALK